MWTILLQNTQTIAPGTEDIKGNEEACIAWLKENQIFYTDENPNPSNAETSGSKYFLMDIDEADLDRTPVVIEPTV